MKYNKNIFYFSSLDGSQFNRVQFPGENSDSNFTYNGRPEQTCYSFLPKRVK